MSTQIIAMTCIPGRIERGSQVRTGFDYAKYGQATWRWWCKQRGIEFVILDRPLGGEAFELMPPTIQRWLAPADLLREYGRDTRIALIDADTMIRWDAPNFLDLEESHLAAGHGKNISWIGRTISAYQKFFPNVHLSPSNYFNSGVVILGEEQVQTLKSFTEFARIHWPELRAIQKSGNFGSDQTPLNFIVCREREPIYFLPSIFNMLHCDYTAMQQLTEIDSIDAAPEAFLDVLESRPLLFDFIDRGYVWHFSASYQHRFLLMKETWHRICKHYPGCDSLV
jgi:hypothetical protein